ncbi:MAG: hypothetical protein JXA94_00845 [Parachlamydiales bacterium]|nr:hypothetical protein [Parachlamydiales bacterium]
MSECFPFIEQIKNLNLEPQKWAVCGSGPMAIRNLRKARDVDIIVKKTLWLKLIQNHKIGGPRNNLIQIGDIEIWNDWMELTNKLDEMIDTADFIEGLPFVRLKYIYKWKGFFGRREKDLEDIKLIEEFLKK